MRIKFWGVRGSIPCPGPATVKYGGNTPCLELRFDVNDRLIIIDAGSGIRELGMYMMGHDLRKGPIKTEIFLTHTHWDHIMGFPFFVPIYVPGTRLKIYGPVTYGDDSLETIVGGQLTYRYFPVRQQELMSDIEYVDLKECVMDIGDGITVRTKYLNHPILCLGYRFEYRGKVLVTTYDTERFQNVFCTDPNNPGYDEQMAAEAEAVAMQENQRVKDFFSGADLLIHDAQYTLNEYESAKRGWGHTAIEQVVAAMEGSGVKQLALFHHEPVRTDDQMDALAEKFARPAEPGKTGVFFAKEGMEITL